MEHPVQIYLLYLKYKKKLFLFIFLLLHTKTLKQKKRQNRWEMHKKIAHLQWKERCFYILFLVVGEGWSHGK